MSHDAIHALLLSVVCFEHQFDRPPTMDEIVEMRGGRSRDLIRHLDGSLIKSVRTFRYGTLGWSCLEAQGQRTY